MHYDINVCSIEYFRSEKSELHNQVIRNARGPYNSNYKFREFHSIH